MSLLRRRRSVQRGDPGSARAVTLARTFTKTPVRDPRHTFDDVDRDNLAELQLAAPWADHPIYQSGRAETPVH